MIISRLRSLVVFAAALVIVNVFSLDAQRTPQVPRVGAAIVARDTAVITIAALPARAPIAFRPFVRTDSAGRALSLDTTITLPNGRTLTRRAFFDSADALERRMNALGYSLRTSADSVLSGLRTDPAVLRAQRTRLQAVGAGPFAPLGRVELLERRNVLPRLAQGDTTVLRQGLPRRLLPSSIMPTGTWQTMPAVKSWGQTFDFGQSKTARVRLAYGAEIRGDTLGSGLSAAGTLDGWLLGATRTLMQVKADAAAPLANASGHATFDFSVLGTSRYSQSANTSTFAFADTLGFPVNYHVDAHWAIGPIPITLTLGARGDASLAYELTATPGQVLGGVTPSADLEAYGDADVDLILVSAGAGVELTLIDASLPLTGQIAVVNVAKLGGPIGLTRELHADLSLEALNGDVNLHAKVYYPCFGICSKTYKTTILEWDGFTINKNLVTYQDYWPFKVKGIAQVSRNTKRVVQRP